MSVAVRGLSKRFEDLPVISELALEIPDNGVNCFIVLLKLPEIKTFNVVVNAFNTGQHVLKVHRVCSVFLFQATRILRYSEFCPGFVLSGPFWLPGQFSG